MLESLDKSNMKRMSIESPEKEGFFFNADKEISSEAWQLFEDQLKMDIEKGLQPAHIERIYYALHLGKDFRSLIKFDAKVVEERMKANGRSYIGDLSIYSKLLELAPQADWTQDFGTNYYSPGTIAHYMEEYRKTKGALNMLQLGYYASQLEMPRYSFSKEDLEYIESVLQTKEQITPSDGFDGIELAAMAKKLNPDSKIIDIYLNKEKKDKILKSTSSSPATFFRAAYWYHEISPDPELVSDETKAMPEQRSF